jgi:2-alkenal reductase
MRSVGTVAGMRPWAAAGLAVVAAALGAGAALLVASQAGLGDATTTVLEPADSRPAETVPPIPRSSGSAFDPAALYAARSEGVVTIYANLGVDGSAQGSGFVVNRDGVILTNAHVITNVAEEPDSVRGAKAVYVEFSDGERVAAKVVGWDLFSDVGVVRVAPGDHTLVTVPLGDSSRVVVGEPVAAIGSPFGKQTSLSVGVVSATGRSIDSLTSGFEVANAIQTDTPINKGNSGGPLFDADGRVIGINAQIQSTSGEAEGVGFAIPIDVARRSLEQLLATGRVRYAYIGVRTQDVTPGIAKAFDLGAEWGALVTRVEDGTPAADAGLRGGSRTETFNGEDYTLGGDVIVAIGGTEVKGADDVARLVTTRLRPGQTVPFTVIRGTRRLTVDVTLADRPSRTP